MAWSSPSSAVRGEYRDERAVGLTLTLTRGSGPRSSHSRWSSGAQRGVASTRAASSSPTRLAYRSASGSVTVFSPRRSTVNALPCRQRPCNPSTASAGSESHDELPGHLGDVVTGDGGRRGLAEGDVLSQVEPEVERLGDVGVLEVLLQVAQDVGVAGRGREDVDEAEQLGLEGRVRHGPLEHPLGPPGRLHQAGALLPGQLGQLASDRGGGGIERRAHHSEGTAASGSIGSDSGGVVAGTTLEPTGGVAEWFRQGPAKPCTAVRFRSPPRSKGAGQSRFPA